MLLSSASGISSKSRRRRKEFVCRGGIVKWLGWDIWRSWPICYPVRGNWDLTSISRLIQGKRWKKPQPKSFKTYSKQQKSVYLTNLWSIRWGNSNRSFSEMSWRRGRGNSTVLRAFCRRWIDSRIVKGFFQRGSSKENIWKSWLSRERDWKWSDESLECRWL